MADCGAGSRRRLAIDVARACEVPRTVLTPAAARHRTPGLAPAGSGRVSGQPWLRRWASADSVAAQELRDLRAGRFRVVGRQGDVRGGGAGLDEGADGGGPVGGGVVDLGGAAADRGPVHAGGFPGG